jgi:hypothetical protein
MESETLSGSRYSKQNEEWRGGAGKSQKLAIVPVV